MTSPTSSREHFEDPRNERALAFLALENFQAFSVLHAPAADFATPLFRAVVELAEAVYQDEGQAGPGVQLGRVLARGRDSGALSPYQEQEAIELLMDPPLGVNPDATRLRMHRQARDIDAALDRAKAALREGRVGEATAMVAEAGEEAARRLSGAGRVKTAKELVEGWLDRLMQAGGKPGISPGLPKLKEAIGQLSAANVLVVGGGTNVGKSSFILELMLAAAHDGTGTGLISVEDTEDLAAERLISAVSGMSAKTMHMAPNIGRATEACMEIAELGARFLAVECIGADEQEVCSHMSTMAQRGAKLIVVDYIGEVQASVRQQDRRNEIRWLMKRLKAHANRLGVALVVVSQLARPKDGEPGRKPNKHSLKEAGDLENSAEYIVLLWRDEENDFAPVNIELAKSKTGGVGRSWLMQREICREENGRRVAGSARLREVVRERRSVADHDFPLAVDDFKALLSEMGRHS